MDPLPQLSLSLKQPTFQPDIKSRITYVLAFSAELVCPSWLVTFYVSCLIFRRKLEQASLHIASPTAIRLLFASSCETARPVPLKNGKAHCFSAFYSIERLFGNVMLHLASWVVLIYISSGFPSRTWDFFLNFAYIFYLLYLRYFKSSCSVLS